MLLNCHRLELNCEQGGFALAELFIGCLNLAEQSLALAEQSQALAEL